MFTVVFCSILLGGGSSFLQTITVLFRLALVVTAAVEVIGLAVGSTMVNSNPRLARLGVLGNTIPIACSALPFLILQSCVLEDTLQVNTTLSPGHTAFVPTLDWS